MTHRLVVTLDANCISKSPVNAQILCEEDAGADCRSWCQQPQCDEAERCLDPDNHPREPQDRCIWVAYVDGGVLDAYWGDHVALSDGPVRFILDGEDVYWEFTDDRLAIEEPVAEAVSA